MLSNRSGTASERFWNWPIASTIFSEELSTTTKIPFGNLPERGRGKPFASIEGLVPNATQQWRNPSGKLRSLPTSANPDESWKKTVERDEHRFPKTFFGFCFLRSGASLLGDRSLDNFIVSPGTPCPTHLPPQQVNRCEVADGWTT